MQKRVLYIAFLLLAICNKIVGAGGVDQITIGDFSLYPGDSKEVSVVLTNTDTYVGFQFDLYLPNGITVESFSANSSRIPEGTTPQMAQQADGSYRFVAAALNGNPIVGNDGAVLTLTVKAADSVAVQDYTGYLRNVKISKADGSGVVIAEQSFTVNVKDSEPYAAVTEISSTEYAFTLYYDKLRDSHERTVDIGGFMGDWANLSSMVTTVTFAPSFAAYRPTSTAWWFNGFSKLTAINGIENLRTDDVTDMNAMFLSCTSLPSIDLSHFNTGQVVDMSSMFNECTSLTELDLSSFNTANVSNMEWMFYGCSSLKTIYVEQDWSVANVNSSQEMFNGCTSLVGGYGSAFNVDRITVEYARIDGGTAAPGYFTPKSGFGAAATPTFTHDGNLVFAHSTTEGATIRYTIDGEAPTETTGLIYSDSIRVVRNCTIRAIATRENFTPSDVAEYSVNWFKVANVEFAQNGHTITLTTQTDSATIHYTLSNSGTGEQIYTAPLTLDADGTIEAYATRAGYLPSDTTNFVFHADGVTCSNPVFARNGNVITISTQTENAQIYYTTDGTVPTDQSQLYTDSIIVANNMTIKAIAMRANYYPSQVTTFVVDWFKVETPTMVWDADTLIVSSATEGSLIEAIKRLTSDGDVVEWAGGVNPMRVNLENLYYEIWARKEGWTDSDTLKFYYPYTAWHELLAAVDDANVAIQQATGNDNVPVDMLNELKALAEDAQAMYSQRTANEASIQDQTAQIRDLTATVLRLANAEAEPYAVLSNNNTVLTFYYDKKKEERNGMGVGPFNGGASGRGWHEASHIITTVKFDDSFRNDITLTSTAWWFSELTSLTVIERLTNLNTSNVTDMWGMFEQCSALTSVDLSNFDTRKVEKMAYMFDGCRSLQSLDVSGFNTENVSEMGAMFQNCLSLPSLNVTNFNTANNHSMWGLFNGLTVSTLDLSSFNTAKVDDMGYMFANCSNLRTIFVGSGWTTQSVAASEQTGSVGGYDMFAGCINLVGGAGTTFDPDHVNELYAHIDGGPDNPGYFTDINSGVTIYVQASEAPYLYAFDADGNALNGQFPGNLMTDTATVNGQLFYKTRIYRSVPFNINIIDKDMYRTREIYVISDRYFVYEGTSKYVDVTNSYGNAPEIQISSLALPGNHNYWDKMQLFEVVEAGKKYSMQIDLGDMTFEDNLLQFKLYANACAWLGVTSLVLDAPSYVHSIGNPELIASDRNIVIDLASAPTREFKFEATWNGGTQMEEGWTLKITEVSAVDEPYAVLSDSNTVLTFYYDKKKEERNGMGVGPFTSSEDRGWHGNSMPSNITTVVFDSSFDNYRPTSTAFWFTGMHSLTAIVDIQYLQTQNVTNMNCMFYDCNALTSLDVTGFNTQNVTDMGGMFWGCSALTSLDVTGFNTQNVTDMGAMFRYCSGLTSLDVTGFNTQNATYMGAMFWGCSALTSLDVTDFNTQNVTNMGFMFYDCFALTSIDVTGFNTQNVTYMESMFDGCSALTSLNLLGLNTENVTNMGAMFARCKGLTSLDLSHFDTQNVTNMSSMFWNCPSLTAIYVGSGWTTGAVTNSDDMFSGCTSLVGGKGTAYDATHVDHTYAHIDGGPSNPGYFTDKNAPVIDYAYDGTSGVLTVSGGTTMAEALNAAGGRGEVAKTLTSIIWNNTMPLTNSDLQGLDNPNMLIYVQSDSLAPSNRDNVVVNGFAKNIVLTDVAEGNGDFYCPQAFTAEMVSYTRNFQQQTEVGVSRGWETIALPFAVQTIMHEKNGLIAPFGSAASNKHFWLRQIPMDGVTTGLTQATQILANVPYLISMPNSEAYPAEFNQAGRVTFSSMNVEVPVTTATAPTVPVAGTMIALTPTMKRVAAGQQVYALNVGNAQEGYAEGSVFVAGLRDVRPFEAYTVHNGNGPAPRYVPVNTLGEGSTGIETIDHSPLTNDQWYDLNGRKLQQKPTQKGLYILNGKTVVVK